MREIEWLAQHGQQRENKNQLCVYRISWMILFMPGSHGNERK